MLTEVQKELVYLQDLLRKLDPEAADWLARIMPLADNEPEQFWRELNSARLWGGAGAIANQPLQPPPDADVWQWKQDIRHFREAMIRIGECLRERGGANPDVDSWLLAFHNWNAADA